MKWIKNLLFSFVVLFIIGLTACQNDNEKTSKHENPPFSNAAKLDKEQTFDVVTWNLEWFGAPWKSGSASSFQQQLDSVSSKIIRLDADIYALQEVVIDDINGDNFQKLLDKLNSLQKNTWAGVYSERFSFYFSPDYRNFPAQRLCYIYKKSTVRKVKAEPMFKAAYNGKRTKSIYGYEGNVKTFWVSGRLPYRFVADVNIAGTKMQIDLINIHGKCCKDYSGRRSADAKYLKRRLDEDFENRNIIILGDYNDYYDRSMDGGKSPYRWFYLNNNEKFKHVFGKGIDHISISDELYDEYDLLTNDTFKMNCSISDHQPHMLRLWIK